MKFLENTTLKGGFHDFYHHKNLQFRTIYKTEGMLGFYKGGSMNFSRVMLKECYRSPLRGYMKQFYSQNLPDSFHTKYPDAKNVFTGLTMSMADTFIMCPLERLKVWLMTSPKEKTSYLYKYYQESGARPKDLFRGLEVSFYRSAIAWVSFLVLEDKISKHIMKSGSNEPTFVEQIIIGTACGVLNSAITLPLDTIKTNGQKRFNTENKVEIVKEFKKIFKTHGVAGFYTGFQFRLPHYIIVGIITSGNIHKVDKIWEKMTDSLKS
jgi:hypothetical protein